MRPSPLATAVCLLAMAPSVTAFGRVSGGLSTRRLEHAARIGARRGVPTMAAAEGRAGTIGVRASVVC